MGKGDDSWARAPFIVVFSNCLGLGLFLWWLTFGHAGVPVAIEGPLDAQQLHGLAVRFAIGAVFLWLSFAVHVLRGADRRAAVAVIVALLGNVMYWCAAFCGIPGLVAGGLTMGAAFALFLSAWLERCRCGLGGTLSMILLASALGGFLQLGLLGFSDKLTPVAAVAFPVLSLLLFRFVSRDNGTERDDADALDAEPLAIRSSILQIASILLCNIASGPASYGASVASDGGARSHAIVYFALSVALLFCGGFRKESLFSLLAIASLLCVAPLIVLSDPPGWLVGLVTADFWVVLLYSIAWFSSEGRRRGMLAAIGFRGIAAAYLLSSVSEIAGVVLPGNMAYVGALVVVGMALAAALADLGRGGARGTVGEEGSTCSSPLASDGAVEELANRASLTDGERRVFECLSRGYSLKQVAVRLGITEGAAKYHRHNVYLKLGVSSREELIALVERVAQTREA